MKRAEPTQSVRIKQSDYDILITLMHQEGIRTVTDAISWALHVATVKTNHE